VKAWLDNRWLELGCRLLLAGVFISAGLLKIVDPPGFAKAVFNYQILPVLASNVVAVALPWVEVLAGVALLAGVLRTESALILTGLLVVFMAAIAIALARGIDVECGCFGTGSKGRRASLLTLVQDAGLLAAGLVCLRRAAGSDPAFAGSGQGADHRP
jgi:uncharacterized membrane protein YphA (DoxX/SURF4 family)